MADPEQVQIELNSEKSEKHNPRQQTAHSEGLEKSLKLFKIATAIGFLLALIFLIILIIVAATKDEEIVYRNDPNSYSEIYNIWEELKPTGDVPDIRLAHGSATYNNELLVIYGMSGSDTEDILRDDIWSYSISKNAWTKWKTNGTAPTGRFHFASAIYQDKLYMHGGFLNFEGKEESTNEFFVLDLKTKQWETLTIKDSATSQPPKRGAHEMVEFNGLFYLFGGSDSITSGLYNDLWTYNIAQKKWTQLNEKDTWPSSRLGFNFYKAENTLWLFAGTCTTEDEENCDKGQQNDLWQFFPTNDTWKELAPTGNIPMARRASHSETTISNHSFLIGGVYIATPPVMLNDVHVYDIDTNRWIELHPEWPDEAQTKIISKRFGHTVEEINNKIYVFGGRCGNPKVNGCNDLWVYTPPYFATQKD